AVQRIGGEIGAATGAVAEEAAVVHQAVFQEYGLSAHDRVGRDLRPSLLVDEVGDRRRIVVGAHAHVEHARDADREHQRQRNPPAAPVHHVAVPQPPEAHRSSIASMPLVASSSAHACRPATSISGSIGGSAGVSTISGSSMLNASRKATRSLFSAALSPSGCSSGDLFGASPPPRSKKSTTSASVAKTPLCMYGAV